jgi:hypothetical protein
MVQFTFLELHLDDASLSANTPFGSRKAADETRAESSDLEISAGGSDDESGGGPGFLPPLVGLVVLVGLAIAVRKLVGGDADEEPEPVVESEELTA